MSQPWCYKQMAYNIQEPFSRCRHNKKTKQLILKKNNQDRILHVRWKLYACGCVCNLSKSI